MWSEDSRHETSVFSVNHTQLAEVNAPIWVLSSIGGIILIISHVAYRSREKRELVTFICLAVCLLSVQGVCLCVEKLRGCSRSAFNCAMWVDYKLECTLLHSCESKVGQTTSSDPMVAFLLTQGEMCSQKVCRFHAVK